MRLLLSLLLLLWDVFWELRRRRLVRDEWLVMIIIYCYDEEGLTSIFGEELLDHGVARNVFAVAAVAPPARRSGFGSVRVDATSLAVAVHLVIAKVRRVDFDEFAVARGLVAPLVCWVPIIALEVRRGMRGEL